MALLLSASQTFAQRNPDTYYEEIPRTFYGGLLAGANFCQVDGDNYAGYHKIGLNLGGIVYTHLAEKLAASVEILYSQKGARSNGASQTSPTRIVQYYRANLNYAEVALQLNYFDKRRSHFGAGFAVNRLITATESGEGTFPTPSLTFDQVPFRKMDYQFIIGGNLHLVKGLFLNARFQYSLAPIRTPDQNRFFFAGRNQQFNNVWAVRLMYLF